MEHMVNFSVPAIEFRGFTERHWNTLKSNCHRPWVVWTHRHKGLSLQAHANLCLLLYTDYWIRLFYHGTNSFFFFPVRNDNEEATSLPINSPPRRVILPFHTNTEDYFRKILISGASILCTVTHWMWVPSMSSAMEGRVLGASCLGVGGCSVFWQTASGIMWSPCSWQEIF